MTTAHPPIPANYWLSSLIPTTNRFEHLPDSTPAITESSSQPPEQKSPPIFVCGVQNIRPLQNLLDQIARDRYSIKLLGSDQVKIQPSSSTSECPRKERSAADVKCCNCGGSHPTNYKGCVVYKQLQQKLFPQLRPCPVPPATPATQPPPQTSFSPDNSSPSKRFLRPSRRLFPTPPPAIDSSSTPCSSLLFSFRSLPSGIHAGDPPPAYGYNVKPPHGPHHQNSLMSSPLRIALWNANGLAQRKLEVETFLTSDNIDVLLISETHFTSTSFFRISRYSFYDTQHSDGAAHGGSAILIRSSLRHHPQASYSTDSIQATTIQISDASGPLNLTALYCPPKHRISSSTFLTFFRSLGSRFIAGGDFNSKHPWWGCRTTNPKGQQLYQCVSSLRLHPITTREPTYWPSDPRRQPDLLDFALSKGVPLHQITISSHLGLSSDHTPVLITLSSTFSSACSSSSLFNPLTDWHAFRLLLDQSLPYNLPVKSPTDMEAAVQTLTTTIQSALWKTTPPLPPRPPLTSLSPLIQNKIHEKRRLRKNWQLTRLPADKTRLNRIIKELRTLIQTDRARRTSDYLSRLSPNAPSSHDLWKATRRLKAPSPYISPIKDDAGR
ncbi:UNVERIFIED_CONTAM: hypothetical protein PYX00_008819 [Menopon gallinae]|uniref:Endonuclease/exonuclease/phosphatase domain-containing protein n=1 Tax=Menopon gallinae TaxID=328185 RepID=A0AAW2HPU6_9NEOP